MPLLNNITLTNITELKYKCMMSTDSFPLPGKKYYELII